MKVLCYVNHYFGAPVGFRGKSTNRRNGRRKEVVESCLAAVRSIPGVEVQVCGIGDRALVPIDLDFSAVLDDPKMLIYESLAHMASRIEEFDYFVNIEDDTLLSAQTLANVIAFDESSLVNEILHPNRIETDVDGTTFCVDTRSLPGWGHQRRTYMGRELRVARNPHSAVLIMSRQKLRYALAHVDITYRGRFLSWEMDSAFAYFNSPFALLRPYDDLTFHTVTHLDRLAEPRTLRGVVYQVAPPIVLTGYRRVKASILGAASPPRPAAGGGRTS